jgi:hypothetical protein
LEIFIERSKFSITENSKLEKNSLMIFVLVLIGLVAIFSFGVGSASAANVYVNVNSGNDSWNGLSPVHTIGNIGPTKDIKTGITHVNSGGTLKIANGIYKGTKNYGISISKNMIIQGQSKTGTIINAGNNKWILTIQPGFTVSISNIELTLGNTSGNGGAINNKGKLTVTNCNFKNNTATNKGGAITNTGLLTVKSSNFSGNWAQYGSAINNNGGTSNHPITISNSNFTTNSGVYGAAIYNTGIMTVMATHLNNNLAHELGGGIENTGTLTVSDTSFISNSIYHYNGNGGAIENTGYLSVKDTNFTGNNAAGGVVDNSGILNVNTCNFKNNNVIWFGGAIANTNTLNVYYSNFINNTASSGGAINNYYSTSTLKIIDSTLKDNVAYDNGGAISNSGLAKINYNKLIGNTATTGSAIYSDTSVKVNAILNWWGSNTGPSTGMIYGNVSVKPWLKEPYVTFTIPTNLKTGISKTSTITIKFNENIKASTYYNSIRVKNLSTNKYVTISKKISANTLNIKTTKTRSKYTWYQVTIPAKAIKDNTGNNLAAVYTFKFKTGT